MPVRSSECDTCRTFWKYFCAMMGRCIAAGERGWDSREATTHGLIWGQQCSKVRRWGQRCGTVFGHYILDTECQELQARRASPSSSGARCFRC